MALGTKPSLMDVRNEFTSTARPSTESLRNFYTVTIGTSDGATSGGSGGRLSHFANTGKPTSVTTNAATSVGETSATLNGQGVFNIKPNSALRQYRFQYAKVGDIITTNDTGWSTDNTGTKNSTESFSQLITGLDDGTEYHYRLQMRNGFGIVSALSQNFETDAIVVCSIPENVAAFLNTITETATVSWNAPSDGSANTYQVRRRISSDGVTYGSWVTLSTNASSPYNDPNYCTFAGDGYYIQYAVRSDCLSGDFSAWNQANTLGPLSCSGA